LWKNITRKILTSRIWTPTRAMTASGFSHSFPMTALRFWSKFPFLFSNSGFHAAEESDSRLDELEIVFLLTFVNAIE
jgi:hypothetical protein